MGSLINHYKDPVIKQPGCLMDLVSVATGGNDNKLCVWSLKSTEPVLKFNQHQAAVKVG